MPTTAPVPLKGVRQHSNVVSIRDHLLGCNGAIAPDCARTRCILALTGPCPAGTMPDEADAIACDFTATLAD